MDFTNPFPQPSRPGQPLSPSEVLRALRLDLAAEMDAMSLYQAHIEAIPDTRVQSVLARIRDDEKEHAAWLDGLIAHLDAMQAEKALEATSALSQTESPLLHYSGIAERMLEIDRRLGALGERLGG